MNLQEFFEKTNDIRTFDDNYSFQKIRPRIVCKDGTFLSVQGSEGHYCSPRRNSIAFYEEVEVGYPSIRPPESWKQYFDGEWQQAGVLGWIKRVWKNRSSILWNLKNKAGLGRWYLKSLLSFKDNATASVYGYIPTKLVEDFINSHGGINKEETFKETP